MPRSLGLAHVDWPKRLLAADVVAGNTMVPTISTATTASTIWRILRCLILNNSSGNKPRDDSCKKQVRNQTDERLPNM